MAASEDQGIAATRLSKCGSTATDAASTPAHQSGQQQQAVFEHHHHGQPSATKTGRPQQGQFAAAFQHVAQLHGSQPEGTQEQAQAAQALKGGKIRVLDGQKAGQPFGR